MKTHPLSVRDSRQREMYLQASCSLAKRFMVK